MHVGLQNLPEAGFTEATVREMWRHVRAAKTDAQWVKLTRALVQDVPAKDYLAEVEKVFQAFHGTRGPLVRYTKDQFQVENVQHPWITLHFRAGDCDDLVTLFCAAVGALGHPCRIVTVKADPKRPDRDSHTWAEVYLKDRGWVPADLTEHESFLGWAPPEGKYWGRRVHHEPRY